MGKRYYWLKLKNDFFTDKKIKKLRKIAGGDTYTIIYLKMMLMVLQTDGIYEYEGVEGTLAEELSLELDEDEDNVEITLNYLMTANLIEEIDLNKFMLPQAIECMGSESAGAQRVRDYRDRQKTPKIEAKTNAQRQNAFRAKKICEENGHVPYIEDNVNKKRYGGNYYVCFKRDRCKCAICGSDENLCMHHIDGYDELKPLNNAQNKMITLCRGCHSNVHAGATIPTEVLESIGYYDVSNENNEICNTNVTEVKHLCNVEKEKEKEKREDKDIYTPAPYSEIIDYLNEKCGTAYRSKSKKTQDCIKARLNEGFTVDDFKKVIDNKAAEWLHDEKMCKFLRPETLFGNKFEGYLNQKTVKGKIEIDNDFRDRFLKDNDPVKWGM